MPNYLHRTTFAQLYSVSPNKLTQPVENYIRMPDYTLVAGQPKKYWVVTGDSITLMDQAGMDAVDAAELVTQNLSDRSITITEIDETSSIGIHQREMIELLNTRDNYLVNRIVELQTALNDIKATSGGGDNIRAAIPETFMVTATRTRAVAVQSYKDDINAGGAD